MVNEGGRRKLAGMLGGFGAALLFGGLLAAGTMIVLPFQVGLVDLRRENALADPAFYIFAGFAILFLILAGAGAYLCLRALRLYRDGRRGGSDSG